MLIEDKLKSLYEYYHGSRGAGHTVTLFEGIKGMIKVTKVLFMTTTKRYGKTFAATNVVPVTLDSFNTDCRGQRIPLAIDNSAMIDILSDSIDRIAQLKKEKDDLELKLATIKDAIRR